MLDNKTNSQFQAKKKHFHTKMSDGQVKSFKDVQNKLTFIHSTKINM